jgi:hypothetical protein
LLLISYSDAAIVADLPVFERERVKKGWIITPALTTKLEPTMETSLALPGRKPTKLDMTKNAFIALARRFFHAGGADY